MFVTIDYDLFKDGSRDREDYEIVSEDGYDL